MVDQGVKFAPFRGLQDFILNSAQFRLPDLQDQARWSNRVVNNLIYYQTNYFAILGVVIALIGVIYPAEFLYGFVGTLCGMLAVVMTVSQHHTMRKLRQEKKFALLGSLIFLGYMVCTSIRSIAIFAFPFALSVLLVYIHASVRTRNLKNRISNKVEQLGMKRSPMGLLMAVTGYEVQLRMLDVLDEATK
ncbi:putative PRA1 family protein 2 [Hypsibius exemplaris]|uniref:PRA1 family protein n=1 Tax=Hypsibius exemplaris TaxID=2072580 RepID=A0A1W0WR05_HYPEX|nr:putative PRA1 family protein 2 [Hypsibius exemplaris]